MKIRVPVLMISGLMVSGLFGAAAVAQTAAPADALTSLQNDFGAIVGEAFHRPDPIVRAVSTPGSPAVALGKGLRTSMEVPGAVWGGVFKPFADADNSEPPAPAAAPAPKQHRHVRARHHRASGQS